MNDIGLIRYHVAPETKLSPNAPPEVAKAVAPSGTFSLFISLQLSGGSTAPGPL
jgi:hypothetical protein